MRYLYIVLMLFVLGGCGAKKESVVVPKKQIPEWYMHPPLSSATHLYAVGDGENKKEAITNALTLMASTLSVSVKSEFQAKTVIKEGTLSSKDASYINDIKSDVAKIRISNYEILESEKLGFKNFIVLIRSEKQKLFESLKQELDMEFSLYEQRSKELLQTDALKRMAYFQEERQKQGYMQNALVVMGVLNPTFKSEQYVKQIKDINSDYETLLSRISFSVSSNDDGKNLVPVIAKGIGEKKFVIKNVSSKYHFSVHVESAIQKASAYGFILARSAITITTQDHQGNIIASNKLNITGQSSQSFEIAKENVAFRLDNLLKKEGIEQLLGI